jgi:hypothetical protein
MARGGYADGGSFLLFFGFLRGRANRSSGLSALTRVDTACGSVPYRVALFFAAAIMVRTSDHVRGWAASSASMSARGFLISQGNIWSVWPS